LGQNLGKLRLVFVIIKVRDMDHAAGLALDCLEYSRMRVTERIDADPAEEIEVALPLIVPEIDAFARVKSKGWRS